MTLNPIAEPPTRQFGATFFRFITIIACLVFLYQCWLLLHIVWFIAINPASTALMQARMAEQHALHFTINPERTFLISLIQQKDALLKLDQKVAKRKQSKKKQRITPVAKPTFSRIQHSWVEYDAISNHVKRAVIASEDATFMQHHGFDWQGIQKAYKKNLKKGKIVAGGSTISQQLAKNLFLSSQRSPWRKAQEMVVTIMLETVMSKQRILTLYLNLIEWGDGVFGIDAAAKHYYRSAAHNLNRSQAAKLAAMIPNPRFYDNHQSTRFLNRHASTIQARMHMVAVPQ